MEFREATTEDLSAIVALLADDALGQAREAETSHDAYGDAFAAITADPNNFLLVGENARHVVATCQLTIIPNLTFTGATRGQIEGVRVASSQRGEGTGKDLIAFAIELAKSKGCTIMQLTTNKSRRDALRFYEGLGFEASHEGMKLYL